MKMAVLKPIMWNDKGYKRPAGCPSTSGYSHDHGYGHEEWNGNPRWKWQDFRVFHTEGTGRLLEAAQTGDLGMVMIASRGGSAYAMGIATTVYVNADDEMNLIADAVGVATEADYVWTLPTVQGAFANKPAFLVHWTKQYRWIRWKCPPEQYYWFPSPVLLDPQRVTGKKRLAMHHGRFTLTTPDVLLDIVDRHLPQDREAIRDWLSFGDFIMPASSAGASQASGARRRQQIQRRRNAPTDRRFQYWVEGNRSVEPLHYRLQARFVDHLRSQGIEAQENDAFIDVQYTTAGKTTFCEVKPTDNVETRYAIRAAIGQLLEYRFTRKQSAELQIVVGKKPQAVEIAFVKSIGLLLTYYDARTKSFITC